MRRKDGRKIKTSPVRKSQVTLKKKKKQWVPTMFIVPYQIS
jgi:hypothetical protein